MVTAIAKTRRQDGPDDREITEHLLASFERGKDIYRNASLAVASGTQCLCIVAVTTSGAVITYPLGTVTDRTTLETARLHAQSAAERLSHRGYAMAALPKNCCGYATTNPGQWSMNELAKIGERRYSREYGDLPPHVQDSWELHQAAAGISFTMIKDSVAIAAVQADCSMKHWQYGRPAVLNAQFARQCARIAARNTAPKDCARERQPAE
jgi:hypothetical protein